MRKKQKGREQKSVTFWVNLRNREELGLADLICELKRERKFVQTVRDGIMLINDLRQGNVTKLVELFPFVTAKLSTQTPPDLGRLERRLEMLEGVTLSGIQSPYQQKPLTNNSLRPVTPIGGGVLNVPQFAVRVDDDDDTDFVIEKDTSTNSAMNFLNSVMALQQ